MPRIFNTLIDDRFAAARDVLIRVVLQNFVEADDELNSVRRWLDAEFSEHAIEQRLKHKFDNYRKRDLGQMSPPDKRSRQDKPIKNHELSGDQLRVDRLEAAFESLYTQNQAGQTLRLLGANISRNERRNNALRAIVVSACIVDPDASDYLETVTSLAESSWRGDANAVPRIRGRYELTHRWGWNAIEMLAEACGVLGWIAKPDPSTTTDLDSKPLNHQDIDAAVESAQGRWPTLLDALVHLSQRRDVLPLRPGDRGRDRGVTESIGEPFAFAMRRVWLLLGLSTSRNGAELYDYVGAYARGTINDSTVNRVVAPALTNLDTPEVRRSFWMALFNEFPHIARELLNKCDDNSPTSDSTEQEDSNIKPKRRRIPRDEANLRARDILASNPYASVREVAENVPCSVGLVSELPAWQAVMERRRNGRTPKVPKVVSLTAELEANIDQKGHIGRRIGASPTDDDAGKSLDDLIAEQELDYDPSPLDDSPSPPVRARRKL